MGTRRVLKIAGLAAVILLCLFGLVGGGLSGGLLMLGLSALIIGLAAAIVGHGRSAFIASRRVGGAVAGAGVGGRLIGGGAVGWGGAPPAATADLQYVEGARLELVDLELGVGVPEARRSG